MKIIGAGLMVMSGAAAAASWTISARRAAAGLAESWTQSWHGWIPGGLPSGRGQGVIDNKRRRLSQSRRQSIDVRKQARRAWALSLEISTSAHGHTSRRQTVEREL
jgi:hypothetical protein